MTQKRRDPTQRWKCVCAYDGSSFAGWQFQAKGTSIQEVIEARLAHLFGGLIRIHASGRTDTGVHAMGQVFHFDAVWKHGGDKLRAALRAGLPSSIQIKSLVPVSSQFHARFSATRKTYVYHLFLGEADPFIRAFCWSIEKPLDMAAMNAAARVLRGTHDFRAFSALNGPPREDTVRTLYRFQLVKKGRKLRVVAQANGFMYKMVRTLVGAVVAVGDGKVTLLQLKEMLASRTRIPALATAPPRGLFLMKVYYGKRPKYRPRLALKTERSEENAEA